VLHDFAFPGCQALAPGAGVAATPTESTAVQLMSLATNMFPLWVLLGAVVGLTNPAAVTWQGPPLTAPPAAYRSCEVVCQKQAVST
jgi:hypothetical protein